MFYKGDRYGKHPYVLWSINAEYRDKIVKRLRRYKENGFENGQAVLAINTIYKINTALMTALKEAGKQEFTILMIGCKEPLNAIMIANKLQTSAHGVKVKIIIIERKLYHVKNLRMAIQCYNINGHVIHEDFLYFSPESIKYNAVFTLISGSMTGFMALKLASLKRELVTVICPMITLKMLRDNYEKMNTAITTKKNTIKVSFATLSVSNMLPSNDDDSDDSDDSDDDDDDDSDDSDDSDDDDGDDYQESDGSNSSSNSSSSSSSSTRSSSKDDSERNTENVEIWDNPLKNKVHDYVF